MKALFKNVIVAVNGSQSSIQAAMYSIIMAKKYSFSLKFVYVVDTATMEFLDKCNFLISSEVSSYEEELRQNGKNYLEYVTKLAKSKGVLASSELRTGSVCSEIIKVAEDSEADLIILGGHDSSGTIVEKASARRSVALTNRYELITYARCPVLVVHKPDVESLFKIS